MGIERLSFHLRTKMNQMKLKTVFSLLAANRCAHRTPSGRQCRLLASNLGSGLCPHHHAELEQLQNADVYPSLSQDCQGFQTAQGINHSLHNLYWLLATNQISARRAAILAYINSLQLRTLPAIDADWKAGISDPTASPAPTAKQNARPVSPSADAAASTIPEPVFAAEKSK